ncbi:MAG: aminopeptidase [Rikenellaceae bacterium]
MKKLLVGLLLFCAISFGVVNYSSALVTSTESVEAAQLYSALKSSENVVSVEKLETELFPERYLVKIKQPIDHKNPEKGTFIQRFIVSHIDFNAPVVLVTEGYGGAYGLNPKYRDEISRKLNSNQVVVEHRYFLESTPKPCDWQYMTGENSASDLHNITMLLKKLYTGKWISTGISKGGQTTMIYRTFFPNDVDISVPYVGPICFGVEDGRHEPFINQCGTQIDRDKILAFQREVLLRKAKLVPMLKVLAEKNKWNFGALSFEEVIDYCVLEYSFSIWQWGTKTSTIPDPILSSDKELFDHFMNIAGAQYFGEQSSPIMPFFVQAATDLGYYGYDTKPFKGLLTIKSAKGYLNDLFLPEEAKNTKFNHSLHKEMYKFLGENDPKMIFIYGEFDPWTAAAPAKELFDGKKNMFMYVKEGGSHSTRIASMPENVQKEIWDKINSWLKD